MLNAIMLNIIMLSLDILSIVGTNLVHLALTNMLTLLPIRLSTQISSTLLSKSFLQSQNTLTYYAEK